MKIDFHTHGRLAKRLPFSEIYTEWLFEQARAAGLDALCLTEHFNTVQFGEIYRYLFSVGRMEGDSIVLENGLRIFPGMETDIAEGGHILTIGCAQEILELNQRLEPYKEKGSFLPFEELMEQTYEGLQKRSRDPLEPGVDRELLQEELHQALAKAIDSLPPKQKQIISLYYYENLNLREIGQVLGLSQQRISQIRMSALNHLRQALEEFRDK